MKKQISLLIFGVITGSFCHAELVPMSSEREQPVGFKCVFIGSYVDAGGGEMCEADSGVDGEDCQEKPGASILCLEQTMECDRPNASAFTSEPQNSDKCSEYDSTLGPGSCCILHPDGAPCSEYEYKRCDTSYTTVHCVHNNVPVVDTIANGCNSVTVGSPHPSGKRTTASQEPCPPPET